MLTTEVTKEDIYLISKFIVEENYKHHSNILDSSNIEKEISAVYNFEMDNLNNSIFHINKDKQTLEILASIRSLRWDGITKLPIETIFNIEVTHLLNGRHYKDLWHIGRFAISNKINSITLLKDMIIGAISPICDNERSITLAECDQKLLRTLETLGINAQIIGKPKMHLESITYPVLFSYHTLLSFLLRNSKNFPIQQVFNTNKNIYV